MKRPPLATYSLLPVVQAFARLCWHSALKRGISRSPVGFSHSFPEYLSEAQRIGDHLAELGALTLSPDANIIKLPNISASHAPA
jgi:isocitrate dehydrogenase